MKILLLSPQPFYQVRGTPIAIDLLVSTLSKQGHDIDLLTYNEGENRNYSSVNHYRTSTLGFLKNIQPGFSFKKLLSSVLLFFKAISLLRKNEYDLIHANEEAVFMALLYKKLFKVAYVYDMDSSLTGQMVDKMPKLASVIKLANSLESKAIKESAGVLAVCEALCDIAKPHNENVQLLTDVSMLDRLSPGPEVENINEGTTEATVKFMYVGNLETYQGVDLMIDAFAKALSVNPALSLTVIGGSKSSIRHYQDIAERMGLNGTVRFLGPKPFEDVGEYLSQADVLISPRIQGENTPMKIYNYMASGKAIIATDIVSHTQVLTNSYAKLVAVSDSSMAVAMTELAANSEQRQSLAHACKAYADKNYSVESFEKTVASFFSKLKIA